MKKSIILLVLLISITGCGAPEPAPEAQPAAQQAAAYENVNFKTQDGVDISATYYKGNSSKGAILLHMVGRDRQTWLDLPLKLQENDYNVLAIDFRGHGGSQMDFRKFSDADYIRMIYDIQAAKKFMADRNINTVYLIGASVGANLALKYAASDSSIGNIILLSPGLDFKGVATADIIPDYNGKILIVASEDDSYSADSSKVLDSKAEGEHRLIMYTNAGHGTEMLIKESLLRTEIITWLG